MANFNDTNNKSLTALLKLGMLTQPKGSSKHEEGIKEAGQAVVVDLTKKIIEPLGKICSIKPDDSNLKAKELSELCLMSVKNAVASLRKDVGLTSKPTVEEEPQQSFSSRMNP